MTLAHILNVNQCQSPHQTYNHHHRVSHTKRPTTTPLIIKTNQMISNMFGELALSTRRFPGFYHFSLCSFVICIVRQCYMLYHAYMYQFCSAFECYNQAINHLELNTKESLQVGYNADKLIGSAVYCLMK